MPFLCCCFLPIFWVGLLWCCIIFAPSGWCCSVLIFLVLSDLYVSSVGGGLSPLLKDNFDGANELNQVAVMQMKVKWSFWEVLVLSLTLPFGWRCLLPLKFLRGGVFTPPLFGRRCFPDSLPSGWCSGWCSC